MRSDGSLPVAIEVAVSRELEVSRRLLLAVAKMKHEPRETPLWKEEIRRDRASSRRLVLRSVALPHPSPKEQPWHKERSCARGSRYYAATLPSFLPSCHFLTMYFPLLVSRANNGQEGGRGAGEKGGSERGINAFSSHPPSYSFASMVYMYV